MSEVGTDHVSKPPGLSIGRALFVAAAVGFGWWGLRDEWSDVLSTVSASGPIIWAASFCLVLTGLIMTGLTWNLILNAYGHRVPLKQALAVFFVGQLGKYIPGSVWSFGAQVQMARRWAIPARTTIATGVVFIGWNLVTATLVGSSVLMVGGLDVALPAWIGALGVLLGLGMSTPPVVNWLGSRVAGPGRELHIRWHDSGALLLLMSVAWVSYGISLLALFPSPSSRSMSLTALSAMGSFALAYVAGVLVVIAPAGLGVREATLTILLAPIIGLAEAAGVALLARVVHTLGDFVMAALAWLLAQPNQRA